MPVCALQMQRRISTSKTGRLESFFKDDMTETSLSPPPPPLLHPHAHPPPLPPPPSSCFPLLAATFMKLAAAGQVGPGTGTWDGGAGLGPNLSRTCSGVILRLIALSSPPTDFLSLNKKPPGSPQAPPDHLPTCYTGVKTSHLAAQPPSTHRASHGSAGDSRKGRRHAPHTEPCNTAEEARLVHTAQSGESRRAGVWDGDRVQEREMSEGSGGQRQLHGTSGDLEPALQSGHDLRRRDT